MGAVKRSVVVAVLAMAVGVTTEGVFVAAPRPAYAAPLGVEEANAAAAAATEPLPVPRVDPESAPAPLGDLSEPVEPPDGEYGVALAEARDSGRPVELASRTTEATISRVLPDGKIEVQSAAGPVRTRVDGTWVPVDTTLEVTAEGVQPAAVTEEITFSAGGDGPMAVLGDDAGAEIAFAWPQELPAPELAGSTATYRDVLPDVDLVLTATRTGFEQLLVVNSAPDAATLAALTALEFPMSYRGAALKEGGAGDLRLLEDGSGEVLGSAATPLMWDARTDPATDEPVAVREVGLELAAPSRPATDATLVLSPPREFLTDPATVYPVTIDPSPTIEHLDSTFVQSNIANTPQAGSTELRVGTFDGGATKARSFLLFDVSAARDAVVQSASLSLWQWHSYSCTPTWVDIKWATMWEWNVTWNTQPYIGDLVGNAYTGAGYSSACPDAWVTFNLTDWARFFADAYNKMDPWMPLAVVASNDLDSRSWKKYNSGYAGGNIPTLTYVIDGNCNRYAGHQVCGAVRDRYEALGAQAALGWPTNSTTSLKDGGSFNHFEKGSIYFSPASGARVMWNGDVKNKWAALGWENSVLGYPITDVTCGLRDGGCFAHFQGGSVYNSPASGARTIRGSIRDRWAAMGWERSYLGYPTTDETCGLRDGGCFNHFQGGSIYYSPSTGAHDINLAIRGPWAALGWENSWLGYPTSGSAAVAGGTRNLFQAGNVVYEQRTASTVVGAGELKHPTQFQRVTQARTQLKAATPVRAGGGSYDAVRFEWRPYSLTPSEGWTGVEASTLRHADESAVSGDWLPVVDEAGGKASAVYTWNATASIPADGLVQVRGCFRLAGTTADVRCTAVQQITVDRAGLTGANATADAGPGTVSLLTGAYAVVGRDAEVTAPHGGLAATRSFASNDPNRAGPLGPGWRLSLAVDEAGADYAALTDRTETVLITRDDGTGLPFVRKSSAAADLDSYVAEGEAATEGATLTFAPGATGTPASYVLTDLDGDTVTFTRADGGTGHQNGGLFRVTKVEAIRGKAGSTDLARAVTSVTYTAAGNPRLLLAPTDAGAACPDPTATAQPAGCRALEFVYTGTGTAERLASIRLWAHGAAAPAGGLVTADTPVGPQTVPLATYRYDTAGRLAEVTDPRSGLSVGYGYRADGRLQTITPAGGTAAWTLGYDERALPRLISATLDDVPDTGLAAQRTSVRYDVPRDGGTPGLPALTAAEVARWGQQTTPTDMTAVFDPATVPDTTPTETQWRGAVLHALDVNGRVVNTATYGGTVDQDTGADQAPAWRISTTEYDAAGRGNVVRTLSAGNRDRALAAGADAAAEAAQARLLDEVNEYSADGLDLLRSWGPTRRVVTAAGDKLVPARTRTTTVYDAGTEPGHPTPGVSRHLPVRTVVDAVQTPATGSSTDPALPALDGRSRVTVLEYGTANAWKFSTPTATRVDPGGAPEVITRQVVDEQGRTTSRTLPAGGTSTTTAATTTKSYYAASHSDPGCVNAAWAGWLCKSAPGGAPDTGLPLPTGHVTGYDIYGNPTRTVETGAGVTRTADTGYDPAGRARRSSATGTGGEVGQARPAVETTYTAAGLVATTRLLNADGTPAGSAAEGTGPIDRAYDAFGRVTSYTDGTGLVTTSRYDTIGRLVEVANAHGTRTIGYDGGGERGSLPTRIEVSDVGVFTARYGADGTLAREELPGGMAATTIRDAAGDAASLSYTKTTAAGTAEWLRSTAMITGFHQVDSYRLATATGLTRSTRFGYDNLGRLTSATDGATATEHGVPTGGTCTRRYGFDVNSNRVSLAQAASAGAPEGTCPATVPATDAYGYDTADRLQPAGARGALRYDALGRTRVLPSADTVDGGGDLAIDFYLDDLVASITQADRTSAFGLDAAARRVVRTDTSATTPGASRTVSHYTGDDDNPDTVTESDNTRTRNIGSFGGLAAVVTRAGTAGAEVRLQLANLHGDITATVPVGAAEPAEMTVTETTEYGLPRAKPAPGTTMGRYGWLGTHQRDASTPGGLTLMGVRLYAPTLGRFLTIDPVEGGSANPYEYAVGDPVNKLDLDGKYWGWVKGKLKRAGGWAKKNWRTVVQVGGAAACLAITVGACFFAGVGIAALTNFSVRKGRLKWNWKGALIDAGFAGVGAGIGRAAQAVGRATGRRLPWRLRLSGASAQFVAANGMADAYKRDARQRAPR